MRELLRTPATTIWLLLVAATGLSWILGTDHGLGATAASLVIIGVAAVKGYGQVTLKDIARDANVAESVLYRHFPSKSDLFREAVLEPLVAVLASFSAATGRYAEYTLDNRSLMRLVVGSLIDELGTHRAALRSISDAEDDLDAEDREALHAALADVLVNISAVARQEGERRQAPETGLGLEMTVRVLVGAIISLVVHDEWILRGLPHAPDRSELLEHLVEIMLRATASEPE